MAEEEPLQEHGARPVHVLHPRRGRHIRPLHRLPPLRLQAQGQGAEALRGGREPGRRRGKEEQVAGPRDKISLLRSEESSKGAKTGWGWWSVTWVGLTLILDIPLSARFCLGRWKFGRIGWSGVQDGRTPNSKSTQLPNPGS